MRVSASFYLNWNKNFPASLHFRIVYCKQWNCLINVLLLFSLFKKYSKWSFIQRTHQPNGFYYFEIYAILTKVYLFQLVAFKIYAIIK